MCQPVIVVAASDIGTATSEINRMAIEGYSDFAAHAGVAAISGLVVALPADSGTGKTTMVGACLASGWSYLSDEALCLRYDDGLVEPFQKPLALSPWSARAGLDGGFDAGGVTLTTAGHLGGTLAQEGLQLTDLVRLERAPGSPAMLAQLHRAEAVPLLLGMSFNHYRNQAKAFALATGLAQRCRTWSLRYSDPMEAAALLRGGLG